MLPVHARRHSACGRGAQVRDARGARVCDRRGGRAGSGRSVFAGQNARAKYAAQPDWPRGERRRAGASGCRLPRARPARRCRRGLRALSLRRRDASAPRRRRRHARAHDHARLGRQAIRAHGLASGLGDRTGGPRAAARPGAVNDCLRLPSRTGDCLRLPSRTDECLRLSSRTGDCLRLPPITAASVTK